VTCRDSTAAPSVQSAAMPRSATNPLRVVRGLLPETPIALALATGAIVLSHWSPPGAMDGAPNLAWSAWLVAAILACAFRAMSHADALAEHFGEPLGTLILTISAIVIEVAAVCAVMLGEGGDPTVARDTMFAVLMILLNLVLGLSVVLGTRRRTEIEFNPMSATAYLPLLIALASIVLVLPRFTSSEEGGWMSDPMEIFVGLGSIAIYASFLWMQTTRHRAFFAHHGVSEREADSRIEAREAAREHVPVSPWRSGALLVLALVGVVAIAEGLAGRVQETLDVLDIPSGIGGVFIALLVLAPEGLASLRAASRGEMQRAVNVVLGSGLSTIGLTVPAVIAIRFLTDGSPELGLQPPYIVLLATTAIVASLTLARGRLNLQSGIVHLLLFLAWIVTILDEG
jgi:Ca2+:H+ antiporter